MIRHKILESRQGFTLAELIVVVALIAILLSIATPGFMLWYRNTSLQVTARDLYTALKLTQANAARRNQNCAITFSGGGYVAYVDADKDFQFDAGEIQLAQFPLVGEELGAVSMGSITYADNSAGEPTIAFRPNALPVVNGTGLANGSVTFSLASGRQLVVGSSISGNITVKTP